MSRLHARALCTVSFTALAALALPAAAFAQPAQPQPDQPAAAEQPAAEQPAADNSTAIVVTGTRINRPNLPSSVPITSVTSQELTSTGDLSIGDRLNQLP